MLRPFALKRSIGPDSTMDLDDVLATKKALNRIGVMPTPSYGLTPYPDQAMIDGLKTFQRHAGLRVDGVMNPDGPTAARLGKELQVRARDGSKGGRARETKLQSPKKLERPDTGLPRHRPGDDQVAVAPLAVPFAVWLIPILGVATAAAAMQIYRTLSPARQRQLREQYEGEGHEFPKNFCTDRWLEERDRCNDRDPMWIGPCKSRARDRFRRCIDYGGRPDPDEPEEWSTKDEEIWWRD